MAQNYTVQFANKLDGQDQYGNVTYSVQFQGEQGSCLVRVRGDRTINPGDTMFGRIDELTGRTSGKPYRKFTREQQDQQTPQATTPHKEGGAGAKQGMCLNNAAAYLTAVGSEKLSPQDFAKEVESYARELYEIDLTKTPEIDLKDVNMDDPIDLSEIPDFK